MNKEKVTSSRTRHSLGNRGSSATWAKAAAEQRSLESKSLNTKYLPLSLVDFDSENARITHLTREDLLQAPKLTEFLTSSEEEKDAVFKTFKSRVLEYFASSPSSDRKIDDYLKLAVLAISIGKPENLINPVSVYPDGSRFKVNAGNCRTMAHFLLDAKHIAAVIRTNDDSILDKAVYQYKENIHRSGYSLHEEIFAIIKIKEQFEAESEDKLSIRKFMKVTGLKRTKSGDILAIVNAFQNDSLFREAIENRALTSIDIAQKISRISNIEERHAALHHALSQDNMLPSKKENQARNNLSTPTKQKALIKLSKTIDLQSLEKLINHITANSKVLSSMIGKEAITIKTKKDAEQLLTKLLETFSENSNLME